MKHTILTLTVSFLLAWGSQSVALDSPVDLLYEGETTGNWICNWFPLVDAGNYMTRIIDKRINMVIVTWDNNGDGHLDVQHNYKIVNYSPGGIYPIIGPVPYKIILDMDLDHNFDIILVNESGKGTCSAWRSQPVPQKPTLKKNSDCIQRDCDRKHEGGA